MHDQDGTKKLCSLGRSLACAWLACMFCVLCSSFCCAVMLSVYRARGDLFADKRKPKQEQ